MDWLGELVGERQGVRILPTAHFSMGEYGPIPVVDPPPVASVSLARGHGAELVSVQEQVSIGSPAGCGQAPSRAPGSSSAAP